MSSSSPPLRRPSERIHQKALQHAQAPPSPPSPPPPSSSSLKSKSKRKSSSSPPPFVSVTSAFSSSDVIEIPSDSDIQNENNGGEEERRRKTPKKRQTYSEDNEPVLRSTIPDRVNSSLSMETWQMEKSHMESLQFQFIQRHWEIFSPFIESKALAKGATLSDKRALRIQNKREREGRGGVSSSSSSSSPSPSHSVSDTPYKVPFNPLELPPLSTPPFFLADSLRDYQLIGLHFLVAMHQQGAAAILGDQMGLGKTAMILSFICWLKAFQPSCGPHIVACPLSVLDTWILEGRRWCPSIRMIRHYGSSREMDRQMREEILPGNFDVIVTTYESIAFRPAFANVHWGYVFVDEGHRLKSDKTIFFASARRIPSLSRVIMTGTPISNDLHELHCLMSYLYPAYFVNSDLLDKAFNLQTNEIRLDLVAKAKSMLSVVMLRRLKRTTLTLPPKTEVIVKCRLSKYQQFIYKRLLAANAKLIDAVSEEPSKSKDSSVTLTVKQKEEKEGGGGGDSHKKRKDDGDDEEFGSFDLGNVDQKEMNQWNKLLNVLMQLRKCCLHPALFREAVPDPCPPEFLVESSGKMKVLEKLLKKLHEGGHRVLIFSNFRHVMDLISEFLFRKGYSYLRLDGSTPVALRKYEIGRFNADPSIFAYVLSTRAGGLGINLQTADSVIIFDSDWNPQIDLQAMDRAHRIGQRRDVRVFRLMIEDTVEERVIARGQRKLYLNSLIVSSDTMIEGFDEQAAAAEKDKLTKLELANILKFGSARIFKSTAGDITDEEIDRILNSAVVNPLNDEWLPEEQKKDKREKEEFLKRELADSAEAESEAVAPIRDMAIREFNGQIYSTNIAEEFDILEGKRQRTSTVIKVGRDSVLRQNNYSIDSEYGRAWNKHDKGRKLEIEYKRTPFHWNYCHSCRDGGEVMECSACVNVFHIECVDSENSRASMGGTFFCPQHACTECGRSGTDVGGILFRCAYCPNTYCDDHFDGHVMGPAEHPLETSGQMERSRSMYFITCSKQCKEALAAEKTELEAIRAKEISALVKSNETYDFDILPKWLKLRITDRYVRSSWWLPNKQIQLLGEAAEKFSLLHPKCSMVLILFELVFGFTCEPLWEAQRRLMEWEGIDLSNKQKYLVETAKMYHRFHKELSIWKESSVIELLRLFEMKVQVSPAHAPRYMTPRAPIQFDAAVAHLALFFASPNNLSQTIPITCVTEYAREEEFFAHQKSVAIARMSRLASAEKGENRQKRIKDDAIGKVEKQKGAIREEIEKFDGAVVEAKRREENGKSMKSQSSPSPSPSSLPSPSTTPSSLPKVFSPFPSLSNPSTSPSPISDVSSSSSPSFPSAALDVLSAARQNLTNRLQHLTSVETDIQREYSNSTLKRRRTAKKVDQEKKEKLKRISRRAEGGTFHDEDDGPLVPMTDENDDDIVEIIPNDPVKTDKVKTPITIPPSQSLERRILRSAGTPPLSTPSDSPPPPAFFDRLNAIEQKAVELYYDIK